MQLSKRWTIVGVLIAVGGFFLHPETCVSGVELIGKFIPIQDQSVISNLSLVIGGTITALGKGIAHKEDQ